MSRTRVAAVGAVFQYTQFALALVSGFILFPLTIGYLGAYDNGLWLITGELAGYLLVGDLGVFAVLPWLVAAKDGAGDRVGIARHLADALTVGMIVGAGFVAVGAGIWWVDPAALGVNPADWGKIRGPLAFVIVSLGVGFPLRAFTALLGGLQDVTFVGLVNLGQTALTVTLTATLIPLGYGLPGLAVAAGVPPLLGGLAAGVRAFARHRDTTAGWSRPRWDGCRHLLGQGFGAWLGSLGVRLQTASTGLVLAALGRPDLATVYAATGKVAQVAQAMSSILPDSGLVGLSQVYGTGDAARTRRVVICLLLLYLLIPGVVAIGLFAANPWFVRAWLGPNFYAGDYVSVLLAVNLVLWVALGGVFKVVGVVGYRTPIGLVSIVGGIFGLGLSYWLGSHHGLAGLAEASVITTIAFSPIGLYLLARVYGVRPVDYLTECILPWAVRAVSFFVVATCLSGFFDGVPWLVVVPVVILLCGGHLVSIRPLLERAPWPNRVREMLTWLRLVS